MKIIYLYLYIIYAVLGRNDVKNPSIDISEDYETVKQRNFL